MARVACFFNSLVLLLWISAPFGRGSVLIEHDPVSCVVVDRFPQLEARFEPASDVRQAYVFFKSEGAVDWYSVPMKKEEAGGFRGTLPKPTGEMEKFAYYIEVTEEAYASSRTEEFSTDVVKGRLDCGGKLAPYVGSASVTIRPPGAEGIPVVPPGFSSVGVVTVAEADAAAAGAAAAGASAGGGVSAATIAVIAGGGAAAAGVAVAATGGDSEAEREEDVLETGWFEGTAPRTTTTWRISEEAYAGCIYTASWDTGVAMSIGEGEDVAVFTFTNVSLSATPGTVSATGIACDQATAGSPGRARVPLVVSGAQISGTGQTESGNSIIETEATRSRYQITGSYTWRPHPERRFASSDPATTPFTLTKTR